MTDRFSRPVLVAVVVVLGFLGAVAFNTTNRLVTPQPQRVSDLVSVARDLETQHRSLQDRFAELRERMDTLEREAAEDSGVREAYSEELERVRLSAGLTGVAGPGVEVHLADGRDPEPGADPNDYLIHDTDIAAAVNALFAGGAEAVEVNGERVVATTPIRCAGTTILVNSTRLGNPYTIRAVGDPEALEQALLEDPVTSLLFGVYASQYRLEAQVVRLDELQVAPYRGSLRPRYAQSEGGGN